MNTVPQMLDFIFRVFVLICAMTIGVMFVFAGARHALAANLKTTAMISDSVFTVGDVFSGLPKATAEKVLGPAPQPGHDIVLNARTLMRIAIALDLPWRPSNSAEQITIRRAATVIDTADIKTAIAKGLKEEGLDGRFDFSFTNVMEPRMILPPDQAGSLEIAEISFDPQHDFFRVRLVAPSQETPLSELEISGKVERLVSVPVITKTLSGNDIIRAGDIDWIEIKSNELQNGIVLNEKDLIGMTPRRMLVAGKPVRSNELERPQLVSRGDNLTITYNDGFMTLTAQGRAMQDGAKGDIIRVVNTSSNKTVEAFVENGHIVTVIP